VIELKGLRARGRGVRSTGVVSVLGGRGTRTLGARAGAAQNHCLTAAAPRAEPARPAKKARAAPLKAKPKRTPPAAETVSRPVEIVAAAPLAQSASTDSEGFSSTPILIAAMGLAVLLLGFASVPARFVIARPVRNALVRSRIEIAFTGLYLLVLNCILLLLLQARG